MGTKLDASRREDKARTANSDFINKVFLARDAIYRLGYTIKSVVVERLIADKSLVPTQVPISHWLSL